MFRRWLNDQDLTNYKYPFRTEASDGAVFLVHKKAETCSTKFPLRYKSQLI